MPQASRLSTQRAKVGWVVGADACPPHGPVSQPHLGYEQTYYIADLPDLPEPIITTDVNPPTFPHGDRLRPHTQSKSSPSPAPVPALTKAKGGSDPA